MSVLSEVSFDHTNLNDVGRIHQYLIIRKVDAGVVFATILEKSVETKLPLYQQRDGEYMTVADLGYCKVSFDAKSSITPYRIITNSGKLYDCDSLSHVVEVILRKWW